MKQHLQQSCVTNCYIHFCILEMWLLLQLLTLPTGKKPISASESTIFFMCSHKTAGKNNTQFLHLQTDSYSCSHKTEGGKKTAHKPCFLRCSSRTGKSPILHLEVNFERAVLSNNIMTSASLPTIHNLKVEDFKVELYIKKNCGVCFWRVKMDWRLHNCFEILAFLLEACS